MSTSLLKRFVRRADGWYNNVTGLGTDRDKQQYNLFSGEGRLDDTVADNLYAHNDVAAVICSALPEYAIQKGFGAKIKQSTDNFDLAEKEQQEKEIKNELKRLKVVKRLFAADVWAHVFGGGVVLIGADDGETELSEPLNEDNIKKINHLTVYDRRRVTVKQKYEDQNAEKYDEPEIYRIYPLDSGQDMIDIHESRLLVFDGVLTTGERKQTQDHWGDSFLQRCHQVVMQFGVSWDTLAHLIQNAGQGVFKMDKLIEAIAADEQDLVEKRLALMDMHRSAVRALTLDAESESFERHDFDFNSLYKGFELLMNRLSMVSRQPITVIMGRSPAGENATGESDMEMWFSRVEIHRNIDVTPQAERLLKLIFLAKEGPFKGKEPENWEIVYADLRTATPKDKAEIENKESNTMHNYITDGVLTKDEVALSKFGPDSDSEISIDYEARVKAMEEDPGELENYKQLVSELEKANAVGDPKAVEPKTAIESGSGDRVQGKPDTDNSGSK